MKKNQLHVLILLASMSLVCAYPAVRAGQNQETAATGVPESLLGGNPDFDLAISLQADERGNFGPCG